MVAAAVIVALVAIRGITLWSALPGEVPVRWTSAEGGFSWSSSSPVHWVDKTPSTAFGQILMSGICLGFGWALIRTGIMNLLMLSVRRFLWGATTPGAVALQTVFHDGLVAWLCAGVSVAMALDSWEMWSLALGFRSPGVHAYTTVATVAVLAGFGIEAVTARRRILRVEAAAPET
jgi:hypothetical protein